MIEKEDELMQIIDRILEGELCSVDAHLELLRWRDKSVREVLKKGSCMKDIGLEEQQESEILCKCNAFAMPHPKNAFCERGK